MWYLYSRRLQGSLFACCPPSPFERQREMKWVTEAFHLPPSKTKWKEKGRKLELTRCFVWNLSLAALLVIQSTPWFPLCLLVLFIWGFLFAQRVHSCWGEGCQSLLFNANHINVRSIFTTKQDALNYRCFPRNSFNRYIFKKWCSFLNELSFPFPALYFFFYSPGKNIP